MTDNVYDYCRMVGYSNKNNSCYNCNNNNSNNIHSPVLSPHSPSQALGLFFPFSQTVCILLSNLKANSVEVFFLHNRFIPFVCVFGSHFWCLYGRPDSIYLSIQFRKISQIFYIFQKITELSVNGLSAFIAGSVFSWVSVVLPWMHIHDERKNSNKNNKQ